MNGRAYYNEIEPFCAEWLRNLIRAGHIAPGDVDERSIVDVRPDDLKGYTQCHFFAGIGIWSAALRRAGWDDARPVWTGSCPCQPLSAAGKGLGTGDERHLWPQWFELIKVCRPVAIFGEQVASRDGLAWFDIVQSDLDDARYTSGAVDICAAGFGAPHIRQRLYWMAYADQGQRGRLADGEGRERDGQAAGRQQSNSIAQSGGELCGVGNAAHQPRERNAGSVLAAQAQCKGQGELDGHCAIGLKHAGAGVVARPGPTNGHWSNPDWLLCRDGKWRPVESGTFPLAHGASARVGRLRAYGNAICLEPATQFIVAAKSILASLPAIE